MNDKNLSALIEFSKYIITSHNLTDANKTEHIDSDKNLYLILSSKNSLGIHNSEITNEHKSIKSNVIKTLLIIPLQLINSSKIIIIYKIIKEIENGNYNVDVKGITNIFTRKTDIGALVDAFGDMTQELSSTEIFRSDFIHNFSHEFKTPIASIAGFAKLLKHEKLSESERQEYLSIIEEEAKELEERLKELDKEKIK